MEGTKNHSLSTHFKLCLMKYFWLYICSLVFLLTQDVSSAKDIKCEIASSCSFSAGCQKSEPMTVNPGSKITLNCSDTGGLARGVTWEQEKQRVAKSSGSSDLYLRQASSADNGEHSCLCTAIRFTRALKIYRSTGSPNDINKDQDTKLICYFSGWPLPQKVYWYKDGDQITNGTKRMYLYQQRKGERLHSTLHLLRGREDQEGHYECSATSRIPGWSSSASRKIQMVYRCPFPQHPTILSPWEISAEKFSNISLTCRIEYDDNCPDDLSSPPWYLEAEHLQNGAKYKMEEKQTHRKCEKYFILSILNVSKYDEGNYSCHWVCEHEEHRVASVYLKVFAGRPATNIPTLAINKANSIQSRNPSSPRTYSGRHRSWLLPVIILSAGALTAFIMIFLQCLVKKKRSSTFELEKNSLNESDIINRLFISFSSKDFDWVTENLITVFEKHSIAYSIHSRDFELGKPIVQNMADSVYGSRQVLLVLSQNYLASNFCREELHMAIQRGVDSGDSSLILVMVNGLKKKQLPAALRSKRLLYFEKHKKKRDWEGKILSEILEAKAAGAYDLEV